jgi:polyhydroxyalkanoate synthesis repressor PhaR
VAATLIKKYGNRRLYDTGDSRYVTLEELAQKIRGGTDVRVVDAKTAEDLTQQTLTQIILESGSAHRTLPIPLLTQMIRLGDDSLGEFFSRYVTAALEMYLAAKRGVQNLASVSPLARVPLGATDALARMWMQTPMGQMMGFGAPHHYSPAAPPPASYPPPYAEPEPAADEDDEPARDPRADDLAEMRRELDELKAAIREGLAAKPDKKKKKKP